MRQNNQGSFLNAYDWPSPPSISDLVSPGGVVDFAFLTNSQVVLMLLTQQPVWENALYYTLNIPVHLASGSLFK